MPGGDLRSASVDEERREWENVRPSSRPVRRRRCRGSKRPLARRGGSKSTNRAPASILSSLISSPPRTERKKTTHQHSHPPPTAPQ